MYGSGAITEFRAAQYERMSTEHQQYSTHNQSDKIREYAEDRGIEIVRTYADDGKSGLSIGGRAALQKLIADLKSGTADFNVVLVYDFSRWGRFQDADESAYYEYICKRAGINVAYCAEKFENDGSPVSTIVKPNFLPREVEPRQQVVIEFVAIIGIEPHCQRDVGLITHRIKPDAPPQPSVALWLAARRN